jgi:tetratricopeptide (TPR) repeat protein
MPLDDVPAPSPLPAASHMPLLNTPLFVGRTEELRNLAAALKAGTAAVGEATAATGLGGIGKTQLAAAFAYRYGQYFAGGVFWLSFAQRDNVPAEFARCGGPRALNVSPAYDGLPLPDQLGLVAAAFASDLPRLLIFDNCEEEDLLADWLPRSGGARVLITSRRATWSPALGVRAVAVGVLPRSESVALLRRFRPDVAENDRSLHAIAEELGDLPLALHMAGSYLKRYCHCTTPATYLSELRSHGLLNHRSLTVALGHSPTSHEQHVARTFDLSFAKLAAADPDDALARALLDRAAFFAAGEPIPRHLLKASADGADAFAAEEALARLGEFGMIEAEVDGALKLHRLLAAFVRSRCADADAARAAVEHALAVEASRLNKAGRPAPVAALLPHLRAVAAAAEAAASDTAGSLFNELGYHLRMIADLAGARAAFERALAIDEAAFGPDHPTVATFVSNLGGVLLELGDLAGARAACERALAIGQVALGPDHPTVATIVSNLGGVLQDLGDLAGARAAFERALAIGEAAFGPDHPTVASFVSNLGRVLQDLGDFAGARAAYERALAIDEAAFGPDHPTVATIVNNLGRVLQDLGDLAGARAAVQRALAIDEAAFGPDHPTVGRDVNNWGGVLCELGDLAGARAAFERALAIDEAALGPDHPTVATFVSNLGRVLLELGDLAGARAAFQRALAIGEAAFGPDHPTVATIVSNLGRVLLELGDLAGARAAFERALATLETAYGGDHPLTRKVAKNLEHVLRHNAEERGE